MSAQTNRLWQTHTLAPARSSKLPPARPSCQRRACTPQLIAAAGDRAPEAIALVHGPAALTYSTLNRRAGQLAAYLRAIGVGPEVPVAISLDRSFDSVIAALAVWKAGGAYLLLDPTTPWERRETILEDAQALVLITRGTNSSRARYTIDLGHDSSNISRHDVLYGPYATRREQLAYIAYTSGTTGRPIGVEVTHGNLLNAAFWHLRTLDITAADRVSHAAPVCADAAILELWPALIAGASISIPSESALKSPESLRNWINAHRITVAHAPAAFAESMLSMDATLWHGTSLRAIFSAPGAPKYSSAQELPFRSMHYYGSPETSTISMADGRAIANTSVYVLDQYRNPLERGSIGELYVGGAGVARGYRNRPDLTADRFFENPFTLAQGARMFRTRDLGRVLPDGKIELCGQPGDRIATNSIEPHSIAAVLETHPAVASATVIHHDQRVTAYVIPAGDRLDIEQLRAHAAHRLPAHMIPSEFVPIKSMPLNSNGQLDRAALTALTAEPESAYRAPQSPIQKYLATVFCECLQMERVGLDDPLTLNASVAAEIAGRIRNRFAIAVGPDQLLAQQNLGTLAAHIEKLLIQKLDWLREEEVERLLAQLQ
jgi:amino acid adenylation domain-containing protein